MPNCILQWENSHKYKGSQGIQLLLPFLWSKIIFWLSNWKYSSLSVQNKFVTYQKAIHCLGNIIFPQLCYSMCLIINLKRRNSVKEKRNHKFSLLLLNYLLISIMVSAEWGRKTAFFFFLKVEAWGPLYKLISNTKYLFKIIEKFLPTKNKGHIEI